MRTVTTADYEKMKIAFLHRHKDWELETSPMDDKGQYHKTYTCTDGHQWYESMRPVYETPTVDVKNLKVKVTIKLLEIEGWSTEDSKSVYCYEEF